MSKQESEMSDLSFAEKMAKKYFPNHYRLIEIEEILKTKNINSIKMSVLKWESEMLKKEINSFSFKDYLWALKKINSR
jgi:hypothetical protein